MKPGWSPRVVLPIAAGLGATGLFAPGTPAAPVVPRSLVNNYRTWTRVTGKRVPMDAKVAALCSAVSPSPHAAADFHVYVNPTGQLALTRDRHPAYPVGTLIVKEKFAPTAAQPNLLTVMWKRDKGFDPKNGDWEYLTQVLPNGALVPPATVNTCRSCHRRERNQDFVFRTYLPGFQRQPK